MRRAGAILLALLTIAFPATASAQSIDSADSIPAPAHHFSWPLFVAGFAVSLAAHEAAHLTSSLVMGATPGIGIDHFRPVIHSGIDLRVHPAQQFIFSAAGMTTQLLINEVILDIHHGPGPSHEFERGILASGVGTVLFYVTLGRNTDVSDVQVMSEASGLSKWTLTAIFGGVAATDVVRIALKKRYAHFFAAPRADGGMNVGAALEFF